LSILGGFAEAAVLVIIARVAVLIAAAEDTTTFEMGPLPSVTLSPGQLVAVGLAFVVARAGLTLLQGVWSARVITGITLDTRRRLLGMYLRTSWSLQSKQRDGRMQELVGGYAGASAGAVNALLGGAVSAFNLSALLLTALFVSVIASVSAAVLAVAIGAMLKPLRAAVNRRSRRAADANLAYVTAVTEFAASLQEARIFGVEDRVADRLDELAAESRRRQLRQNLVSRVIPVLYQTVALVAILGALAIADAADLQNVGSLGAIVLIMIRAMSYAQGVQGGVQDLHGFAPYLLTLRDEEARYRAAAADRSGDPIGRIERLEFRDVSFEYVPGRPVLKHVSFDVAPCEVIGIVGPSGAGKSTLVQLLLRLRDPTSGDVLADGRNARALSLDDWYEHVTFVPQEPRLFAGTVADNIRFHRDAAQDQIERAAKLAHLHDDIVKWPDGYDTPVGERGAQLSGGQRQRLCIARALVSMPDVVVLDEPTSALDVKSEALMRETITELAERATVIVIAHRLSTLTMCDRIMVVLDGELQGFDSPAALESSNQFYREALRLSGMR
jgi:ABC-type multidrug transport system fused ATPase/permease subunit